MVWEEKRMMSKSTSKTATKNNNSPGQQNGQNGLAKWSGFQKLFVVLLIASIYSFLISTSLLKLDTSNDTTTTTATRMAIPSTFNTIHKNEDWSVSSAMAKRRVSQANIIHNKHYVNNSNQGSNNHVNSQKRHKRKGVRRGHTTAQTNLTFDPIMLHSQLHDFYQHLPFNNTHNYTLNEEKRWNFSNSSFPQWMIDYFNWHDYKRQTWTSNSYADERWLVIQCLKTDHKCGGTSDRLRPIVFYLRVAYYTRRIIIIHWMMKPYPLIEFLLPPKNGIDWRPPTWLISRIEAYHSPLLVEYTQDGILDKAREKNRVLMRCKLQDYHAGRYWYDKQLLEGEIEFQTIFHEVWKIFFTPSLAVKERIENTMTTLGLVPYKYTAAHCRVLYAMNDREEFIKKNWAMNAINCASTLRPKTTIFFASDSADATYYAKQYGKYRNANIVTHIPNPNPPLHIEFASKGRKRPVTDFLDTFVDLYIIAQADCVTYNKGGYGLFGLLMSRNATCGLRQDAITRPIIHNPCHWVDDDPWNTTNEHTKAHYVPQRESSSPTIHGPIYLEPMLDEAISS